MDGVGPRDLDRVADDRRDRDAERDAGRRSGTAPESSAIRWSKPFSQSRISHQATGQAITLAMITGRLNCHTSSRTMSRVRAPSTLRMPISLVRRSAVKAARPNRPRQPMITASSENAAKIFARASSALYSSRDDVLAELGLERHVAGDLLPLPLDRRFDRRRIAAIADDHPRRARVHILEHDRVDRRADRAEAGIADHADDGDVDHAGARLEQLALDDLADRVLRRFEAELASPHIR